jgi:hypothetical protein
MPTENQATMRPPIAFRPTPAKPQRLFADVVAGRTCASARCRMGIVRSSRSVRGDDSGTSHVTVSAPLRQASLA